MKKDKKKEATKNISKKEKGEALVVKKPPHTPE